MFLSDETLSALIELGAPPEKLARVLRLIEADAQAVTPTLTKRQERNRRFRDAQKTKKTLSVSPETVEDVSETFETVEDAAETPLVRVRDNNLTKVLSGKITSEAKASSVRALAIAKPNGFAGFWERYPRKVGKGAAEKAYAIAIRQITGPDPPGVLLAALERVKPTWRDPDFIPHPATWLKQRRWEDHPEPDHADERYRPDQSRRPADRGGHRTDANIAGAALALASRRGHGPGEARDADDGGYSGPVRLLERG